MNALEFLAGSIGPADILATWVVQATVLLVIGLLAGRCLRRLGPAVQSALYRTTLAAVLLCPVASAVLASLGFGGVLLRLPALAGRLGESRDEVPATLANAPLPRLGEPGVGVETTGAPSKPVGAGASERAVSAVPAWALGEFDRTVSGVGQAQAGSLPAMDLEARSSQAMSFVPWVGGLVWLAGVVIFGTRLLIGHWRMARLRSAAMAAEAEAQLVCQELAVRMAVAAPDVLRSPFLSSPCLDGMRQPVILLPDEDRENLVETLVHELAHLLRRDGWWNLARQCATAVLWIHPLLWMLSRRIEATAEEVCDDFVVSFGTDRARYAGLLVSLAERRLTPMAPAAVGMISFRSLLARRVARILDSSRKLSTRAGRRVVVLMMAAGFAGTMLAGLIGVNGRERTALGAVWNGGKKSSANAQDGGADRSQEKPTVTAVASILVPSALDPIRAATFPIRGRILDLEGRPVVGARVTVRRALPAKGDDLSAWLESVNLGEPPSAAFKHLEYKSEIKPEGTRPKAVTDADGRFVIEGIGREHVVEMMLEGSTMAISPLTVVTRSIEPIGAKGFASQHGPGFQTIYGSEFTKAVAPGRVVEGVVRDAKTKQPMAGVEVWSESFAGSNMWGMKDLQTTSNAKGHFRLEGFPKGVGNRLLLSPHDDQPYLMRNVEIPDTPGMGPVTVEVDLHKGIWIEGKVTSSETGEPVGGVKLHYLPFLANPFAQAAPEFGKNKGVDGTTRQGRYVSKADGTFRLVGLPGHALVGAAADPKGKRYAMGSGTESIAGMKPNGYYETYFNPIMVGRNWPNTLVEIAPAENAAVVKVDLKLYSGNPVRLRIVDAKGEPVVGVRASGRSGRGMDEFKAFTTADLNVLAMAPDEERPVMLRHEGRKIGKVVRVKPGDDAKGPVVVRLEPLATITGRVVDEEGHPVPGAKTQANVFPSGDFTLRLPEAFTDATGRFVVADVPADCDYSLVVTKGQGTKGARPTFSRILAVAPGQTTDVGEIRLKTDLPQRPTTLVAAMPFLKTSIVKPADENTMPIRGRILDLQGRPVVGARVTVKQITPAKGGDLTVWLEAVKLGESPYLAYKHLDYKPEITPEAARPKAVTDADGRFVIEGLGREHVVEMLVTGSTIAISQLTVVTRRTVPIAAKGFPSYHGPGFRTVYGCDFATTLPPGRIVEGVVRDAKTKQPMAGVEVWSEGFAGSNWGGIKDLKTISDAKGRFRLEGFPKGAGNKLLVSPNDEQPYFMREFSIPDAPGMGPVAVEIDLHKGIWIEGKVTDDETKAPVAGVWLHYFPFVANTFAQATPEFGKDQNVDGTTRQDRYVTKADGTFRLVGLPGHALLGALSQSKTKTYLRGAGSEAIPGMNEHGHYATYYNPVPPGRHFPNTLVEIDPSESAAQTKVDLKLYPGKRVRLRIVDMKGEPVVGVKTGGRVGRGQFEYEECTTADLDVLALAPDEERMVMVRHEGRKLGKVVRVKPGDDTKGPVVVKLEPLATLSGRVLDADGVAMPGAMITAVLQPSGDFTLRLGGLGTDKEGRFVVSDLAVGCEYSLVATKYQASSKGDRFAFSKDHHVESGRRTDVGEIRFKND